MRCSPNRQRGFTLVEVMVAAVLLSIVGAGMNSLWTLTTAQADRLVLRQKAVLILNGEMERLSTLYQQTNFGESSAKQSDFESSPILPQTRWIYDASLLGSLLSLLSGNAEDNFVTPDVNSFLANSWLIWETSDALLGQERNYAWLDRGRGQMARLSWVREIVQGTCAHTSSGSCYGDGNPLRCLHYSGSGTGDCELITLVLEYPYRLEQSEAVIPPEHAQVMTLRTIVGRRR